MPNPNKRSRRRERRRKVARKVAGKVLSHEGVQTAVSKSAGIVASIYGTPAAGMAVERVLDKGMEMAGAGLSKPSKRAQKAAKKAAKKARKETAKTPAKKAASSAGPQGVIGAPPIGNIPGASYGPKPGEAVELVTDELIVGDGGELYELPAPEPEEKPIWMNPVYLAAAAAAAFLILRMKKK